MATSEIEKLERRYAENPHGLTFAPLAEVHRKIGDIPRALELLTAGLELHPNYIPASIVLGRCHQDQGDLAAAEAAFAHVLRLDDENVIALKSLADINERQERYTEALATLRRLVAIDRSNEEAREQLERVQAAVDSSAENVFPASMAAEPAAPAEAAPAAALEIIDLTAEPTPAPAETGPSATAAAEPERRPGEEHRVSEPEVIYEPPGLPTLVTSEQAAAEPAVSSDTRSEPDEPAPAEEAVQPLPGLISAEFQPPLEATGGLGVEMSEDVVLEVSGPSEFSVPDASEDLKSLAARLSAPPVEPTPTPPLSIEEQEPAPATAVRHPSRADTAPEFVPTQTMAEALAKEGHSEEAIRVYRELIRRNGGSPELETLIRELEAAPLGLPSKRRSYRASDTNGQSVRAFFQALLAARVAGGETSNRESTGRAESSATTSGQNGSGILESSGEVNQPVPPAVPSGPPTEAGVSFDEFFNSESGKATPLRHGQGETGKDDLDQFQTWLQNLKR
jgi:pentatricopeptide repeat protein